MDKHSYPLKAVEYLMLEPKMISNWDALQLFYLPIAKPGPGLPREYSRENIIEMAVAVEMMSNGFSRKQVKQAFTARARIRHGFGVDMGRSAGYKVQPESLFRDAPELQPGSQGIRWVLFNVSHPQDAEDDGDVLACVPYRDEQANEIFALYQDDLFSVLPISKVIAKADYALGEWDRKRG
ncbi:MAG: hypothetical protein U1E16_04025 [Hyphomicrobiales bacterium]